MEEPAAEETLERAGPETARHLPKTESRGSERDRLMLRAAVVTIVFSLLALVVVPVIVGERVDRIREETERWVEPADRAVRDIELALVHELAALRGYLLEPSGAQLEAYLDARRELAVALAVFELLLPPGDPALAAEFDQIRELAERWHASVDRRLGEDSRADLHELAAAATNGTSFFDKATDAAHLLREDLASRYEENFARVAVAERFGLAATAGLVLLALLSTGLVVALAGRTRRLAEEANRAHLALMQSNESRARLLRGFTHDLKNPLSASVLHAQLLEAGIFGEIRGEPLSAVGRVRGGITQALELVDQLLELSRAEAGLLRLNLEPVDVLAVTREVIAGCVVALPTASPSIEMVASDGLPPAHCDRVRLHQVLGNVIGNALKYTPPDGRVTVRPMVRTGRAAGGASRWITLDVRDTGPGIPADQLERVFDEFVRLPGTAGSVAGSGIGLTISRQLARAMGGEITVSSEPGSGSTFTIWLRIARAEGRPPTS